MPEETVNPAASLRRPKVCLVCGGDKLMQAALGNSGPPEYNDVKLNLTVSGKKRILGTGASWTEIVRTSSGVAPVVCGDCGYVMWFADKPQELWRVWHASVTPGVSGKKRKTRYFAMSESEGATLSSEGTFAING